MICSNPYDGERIPGTVGFPLPGVAARVADEPARAPRGEPACSRSGARTCSRAIGASRRRPPRRCAPTAFSSPATSRPWPQDGRVAIVGRAKDLIIAGGLNIYPKEIELALDAVPGVAESAVIGVPHPDLGEAAVAVVVRTDPALDEAARARRRRRSRPLQAAAPHPLRRRAAAQRDGQGPEGGACARRIKDLFGA